MKSFVSVFLAVALLGGFSGNAAAIDPTHPGTSGPTPWVPGTWRARVRYLDPHEGRDGRYMTYSYADITASTQANCESQLNSWTSNGNVSVVDYCWFDSSTW